MFKFLKKLFGINQEEVTTPAVEPTIEIEKTIVVEKKPSRAKLPKKAVPKKEVKKRVKPALKVVKAEATPVKKRGRPAKKK